MYLEITPYWTERLDKVCNKQAYKQIDLKWKGKTIVKDITLTRTRPNCFTIEIPVDEVVAHAIAQAKGIVKVKKK